MVSALPLQGADATTRSATATRRTQARRRRGESEPPRPPKRPILELPLAVLSGESEPSDGVVGIAAAVRRCLRRDSGLADVAFASITQARGMAAAIRLARAYVEIRAGNVDV